MLLVGLHIKLKILSLLAIIHIKTVGKGIYIYKLRESDHFIATSSLGLLQNHHSPPSWVSAWHCELAPEPDTTTNLAVSSSWILASRLVLALATA